MAFIKRLGWYLVGLSIGIVFLAFFLKKKSEETGTEFCYFPNCRVLKDIRSKSLAFKSAEDSLLTYGQLDSVSQYILKEGSIDFGKSDRESVPCKIYIIANDDKTVVLKVQNCAEKAIIEIL